ncbi:hypothetical protein [Flavobacterium sp.]|uniref:hypothetical protein n=1 Tax=Flavobacterium sp. TaxID=239 RepID=UPI002C082035|nr:hypothetical protein [Flavobacterium sp.]HSD05842.1 hypothetical protein [Flavobacterium sp.]
MKKIKYIAILILSFMMTTSCTDDGGSSVIDLTEGGVPNVEKTPGTDTSLNYAALSNGGSVKIGVTLTVGRGDVASMNVVGFYTKGSKVEKAVLTSGITTFPTSVTYTEQDLYKAFSILNSPSDFDITDNLVISADVTLKNGTVLKMFTDEGEPLFGADIANSEQFSVLQEYTMVCPLDDASIFNGDYTVTQDDWADYKVGATIPVVYDAAFGTLKFKILNTNNPYVVNKTTSYMIVTIDPETANVTVTSNEIWNYGSYKATVTGEGSVSACTGDINLKLNFATDIYGVYENQTFNLSKK